MTTLPEIPVCQSAREPSTYRPNLDVNPMSGEPIVRPASELGPRGTSGMSLPGPVYLPGVSMRNPITGRGYVYSNYAWSTDRPKITPHNIKEHERSVFTNTNYNSSFYIIHPDWTSEATAMRRIIATERRHWAWDNRPAVQPLRETSRDTYLPLLDKKARTQNASGPMYYRNMVNYLDNYDRFSSLQNVTSHRNTPAATQMSLPAV